MCLTALQWLWQDDDVKLELDDMYKERESAQGEKAKTVLDVLRSRCVRWQLLTLAIPCAGVQFCGINAVRLSQFSSSSQQNRLDSHRFTHYVLLHLHSAQ